MNITQDARGRWYAIRDDGLVKPVDDACPIWVDLRARHYPGERVDLIKTAQGVHDAQGQ